MFSPWGNGHECWRTFEALALGTVPIVLDYGSARSAYAGLPVVVVDSMDEITRANVARWETELAPFLAEGSAPTRLQRWWRLLSPASRANALRGRLPSRGRRRP